MKVLYRSDGNKTGMFAAANHGTLFLDEVGNLNAEVQRGTVACLAGKNATVP